MVKSNYLHLSWSTSRGADTYGYNIARLDDNATGQRFKCMGGCYDMVGTCVGQWLQENYQARLMDISNRFRSWSRDTGERTEPQAAMYGGNYRPDTKRVILDGACGLDCMIRIASAIGVRITANYNHRANRGRGATDGYFVSDFGSADALRAAEKVEA